MKIITQRGAVLATLLLAAMLVPIWIGSYFPAYDYPNHLLEAQIVVHYTDPQFAYADSYEINPGWYLRSNALTTLLLIGLGQFMPMPVAGQMVLSLYMALFLGGLFLLLRRQGTTWPLLLLAPILAYNFALTSGWLNFSYGLALGLYALVFYLRWQEQGRYRDLLALALLLVLIYMAHLMAWALLLVVIAALLAIEPYHWRWHGLLFLAMNSALPLLFITRPAVAGVALLTGPVIWVGAVFLRWLRLTPRLMALGFIGTAGLVMVIVKILEPFYLKISPLLAYSEFDKITFPLRLFSLPHQFLPPNPLLISYNLILLMLLLTLGALLGWSTFKQLAEPRNRWLIAMGLLGLLYVVIPSRTPDIWITEPRVLLFAILVGLINVRLFPSGQAGRRAVILSCLALWLLSFAGTTAYAQAYNRQVGIWQAHMATLRPAQNVLMLREKLSPYISGPTLLGTFNRFYTGEYFSTIYVLEHGGFASRIFTNGPVRPRQNIPIPAYNQPGFRDGSYVAEHCPALHQAYDAVLFWGSPDTRLETQLNDCFKAGPRWPDMAIWWPEPIVEEIGDHSR